MGQFHNDSIFWIEVDKIHPNPYQPRREFDASRLKELAESIRQYGILQPLTVTRRETERADGGMSVDYELIAGERRLRASKLAGLSQVPALIRTPEENREEDERVKLELAIIENLQREDLNPIDRARAFQRLATEFKFTHSEIGKKMGRSREYVSNSLRLLSLPEEMQHALEHHDISEGHTRPLLMLADKPDEQMVLFKEIKLRKMTVREAESIARRAAYEKVRKKHYNIDPELIAIERDLTESLGTRVQIEKSGERGGKLMIDYFSSDDLHDIIARLKQEAALMAAAAEPAASPQAVLSTGDLQAPEDATPQAPTDEHIIEETMDDTTNADDTESEDLYSIKNFNI